MLKSAILTGQKNLFNYIAQDNYYVIENKLLFLTAFFIKH